MLRIVLLVLLALSCGSPDVPVRAPSGGQPAPSPLATPTATATATAAPVQQLAPPTCTPGNPIRTPPQALPPSPGGCLP